MSRVINSGIEIKKKYWETFCKLVENQFMHGGDKYAIKNQQDKEFTDLICEFVPGDSDVDWILGTIMKYLGRYKNFGREKDLLKSACYLYLIWLKKGCFEKEEHDEDVRR